MSTNGVVAECYFLDVGQGTSQVIDLGNDSAIVIDCGPSYTVLGDLLNRRLQIKRIEALILSHNHDDHIGGLAGLLSQFKRAIKRVYLLQDQAAKSLCTRRAFSSFKRECEAGNVPLPISLIRNPQNEWIYDGGDSGTSVRLELLFPNFFQNLEGQSSGNENATCGILLLRCGDRKVLFTGDAEIKAWQAINLSRGGRALDCDIMSVPHHGGQIVRYKKTHESYDELHSKITPDLQWLYSKAIRAGTAIVSVGTSNEYPDQHPLPPQIAALRASGACVMCTQITNRCSDRLHELTPSVLKPLTLPAHSNLVSAKSTDSIAGDCIGCAGTVLAQLSSTSVAVSRQFEHQAAINRILTAPEDHPLCRV